MIKLILSQICPLGIRVLLALLCLVKQEGSWPAACLCLLLTELRQRANKDRSSPGDSFQQICHQEILS
jgi:hypothetical protein